MPAASAPANEATLEVAHVRNHLRAAIDRARQEAQSRRQRIVEAEQAYGAFLEMADPVLRQLTNALRAEGILFTLFTPEQSLRLASDRSRVDFVELTLDSDAQPPQVMLTTSHARGSRTLEEERPLKPGASPGEISEDELLARMLEALTPWLQR
jgi:hypothetical protein